MGTSGLSPVVGTALAMSPEEMARNPFRRLTDADAVTFIGSSPCGAISVFGTSGVDTRGLRRR